MPDTTIENRPALWNPNAAANWSLLFTPAFEAFLHARNAEILGRNDEAKANKGWFKISVANLVLLMISASISSDVLEKSFSFLQFVLLLGWYFSQGKHQIKYVKEAFQDNYPRRSWRNPLLIGFGCLVTVIVLDITVVLV